jgi:hypothetical protein
MKKNECQVQWGFLAPYKPESVRWLWLSFSPPRRRRMSYDRPFYELMFWAWSQSFEAQVLFSEPNFELGTFV